MCKYHTSLKRPFFILGDSRSGTTLLAYLLSRHSSVIIPPESNFVQRLINILLVNSIHKPVKKYKLLDIVFSECKFQDWNINREKLENVLPDLVSIKETILTICSFYAYKQSHNAEAFGIKKNLIGIYDQASSLFNNLRVLWVIRDGRAVFYSKKISIKTSTNRPFETNPLTAASTWSWKNKKLENISSKYENTIKIQYEKLLTDTENVLQGICSFLDLPYEGIPHPTVKYHIPDRYKALHKNIGKKLDQSRVDAWLNGLSPREISFYELIAGDMLLKHGYRLMYDHSNLASLFGYTISSAYNFMIYDIPSFVTRLSKYDYD